MVPMMLAGCVSNPFKKNYVGEIQPQETEPVRLFGKQDLRRLGSSQFDIDKVIGIVPGDDEALSAARSVGAASYWWTSRPKYSGGNTAARQQWKRNRVGTTQGAGMPMSEKTIKWYTYEAIFYADRPKSEERPQGE